MIFEKQRAILLKMGLNYSVFWKKTTNFFLRVVLVMMMCPIDECNVLFSAKDSDTMALTFMPCGHSLCRVCSEAVQNGRDAFKCFVCHADCDGIVVNVILGQANDDLIAAGSGLGLGLDGVVTSHDDDDGFAVAFDLEKELVGITQRAKELLKCLCADLSIVHQAKTWIQTHVVPEATPANLKCLQSLEDCLSVGVEQFTALSSMCLKFSRTDFCDTFAAAKLREVYADWCRRPLLDWLPYNLGFMCFTDVVRKLNIELAEIAAGVCTDTDSGRIQAATIRFQATYDWATLTTTVPWHFVCGVETHKFQNIAMILRAAWEVVTHYPDTAEILTETVAAAWQDGLGYTFRLIFCVAENEEVMATAEHDGVDVVSAFIYAAETCDGIAKKLHVSDCLLPCAGELYCLVSTVCKCLMLPAFNGNSRAHLAGLRVIHWFRYEYHARVPPGREMTSVILNALQSYADNVDIQHVTFALLKHFGKHCMYHCMFNGALLWSQEIETSLFASMRTHIADADLQINGCEIFVAMRDVRDACVLNHEKIFELVADVLDVYAQSDKVETAVVNLLQALEWPNLSFSVAMIRNERCFAKILGVLERHETTDAHILKWFHIVDTVVGSTEALKILHNTYKGGFALVLCTAICRKMETNVSCAELQTFGCTIIARLCSIGGLEDFAQNNGGWAKLVAQRVCSAMENHLDCAQLQICGCSALRAACLVDPATVFCLGGTERVVAAMNAHPCDVGVQIAGCGVLAELPLATDVVERFLKTMNSVLMVHVYYNGSVCLLTYLARLFYRGESANSFELPPGPEVIREVCGKIVALMRAYQLDGNLQIEAHHALQSVLQWLPVPHSEKVCLSDVVGEIMQLVHAGVDSRGIQRSLWNLMEPLSYFPQVQTALLVLGTGAVLDVMQMFSGDDCVLESCCVVLQNLARPDRSYEHAKREIRAVIFAATSLEPVRVFLCKAALKFLSAVCVHDTYAVAIANLRAIDDLVSNYVPESVQEQEDAAAVWSVVRGTIGANK